MLKIGFFGVGAVLLALTLKKERAELAFVVGLAASLLIFLYGLAQLRIVIDFLRHMMEQLPFRMEDLAALMKMLGIAYIAEFASAICKEAGYPSVAVQVETFAKLSMIALGIPQLFYLLEVLDEFLI